MATSLHPASPRPIPVQKAGIGLRAPHYQAILETRPEVGWFEALAENFMCGGPPAYYLERIRRDYPIALHGVGLSVGAVDPPDSTHLERLRGLVERIEPALVSEHVSWCSNGGVYLNDLLPMPYTEEALTVLCRNVDVVQSALKRPILLENPSSYFAYASSCIPEWEFLAELHRRAGCKLLLDVNNIYVSGENQGWDPVHYIASLPRGAVAEIHLAGHHVNDIGDGKVVLIDDHGSPVCEPVWRLFGLALERFGALPSLVEWDTNIPDLPTLVAEAAKADQMIKLHTRQQTGADAA